ncbi:MAG: hypothetical protein ACHQ9S_27000 [Candidatus Binatia bacterium]
METNIMKNHRRRRLKALRLPPETVCLLCGQQDLATLIPTKAGLLQAHHVVGWQYDPDTIVPLCLNCHAIESLKQQDAGIELRPKPKFLERLLEILKSLALFFRTLSDRFYRLVTELAEEIERQIATEGGSAL